MAIRRGILRFACAEARASEDGTLEARGVDREMLVNHGGQRSIRSIVRSVDRVDQFGRLDNFADFLIFLQRPGARDLSCVKVSVLYDAWRPKK